MKMKINTVIKAPLLLSVLLLCSFVAQAENLNLADKPLAAETEGVAPNIMLILDDSGSMSCGSGGRCADDVFYAPGFDGNKEYRCTITSAVLRPLQGNTVVVHVSDDAGTRGTPYFSYGGKYYTWGDNDPSAPINGHNIEGQVCFDPDEKYQVRLHAYTEDFGSCSKYENVCVSWDYWGSCRRSEKQCVNKGDKFLKASDSKVEVFDGNFLNWYFSATIAEWADDTVTGGFKDYGTAGKNHGYWTEIAATDFVTEDVTFCYRGSGSSANNCSSTSGLSSGYVTPERTMLNGSDKNANNKTWFPPLPTYTSGSYTGQANSWSSDGAHYVYDTSSAHYHSSDPSINLIGLKPGVSYNQMRVHVSIDVGKKVVRDLDKAFMSIADFHGRSEEHTSELQSRPHLVCRLLL